MTFGEVERAPVKKGSDQPRGLGLEDLEGPLPFFPTVGAHEVEVVPVGGDFGPEIGGAGEGFAVEELVFHQPMNGLDIALPGVAFGGWNGVRLRKARTVARSPCLWWFCENSPPLSVCQVRRARSTP